MSAANAVADSPLVKCAIHGNDPNWGRIVSAAGYAGVPFDPDRAVLTLAGTVVFRHGRPAAFDADALSAALHAKEVRADRECLFRDWPIAVIIDGAVQDNLKPLVAAALQDNQRAVLVGTATNNEAAVRHMYDLPDNLGEVALINGRMERGPKGRSWPVRPDQQVAMTDPQARAVRTWLVEKELFELPAGKTDQPPTDPQLAKAVEVLRNALKGVKTSARP